MASIGFLVGLMVAEVEAQAVEQPHYLDRTHRIWTQPGDGARAIGKLLVAAPVQIISDKGEWVEVLLSGWTQSGAERVIYAAPGIRVLRAALSRVAVDRLEFTQVQEDTDTGLTWTRTWLRGWLRKPSAQPSLQALWERAEPLFAERCTACHQRRIPHHYTANQWVSYLKIMGPRTGLPKEDQFLIRAFLQYHAQDSALLSPALGEAER